MRPQDDDLLSVFSLLDAHDLLDMGVISPLEYSTIKAKFLANRYGITYSSAFGNGLGWDSRPVTR